MDNNVIYRIEIDKENFDCTFFFVDEYKGYSPREFIDGSQTRRYLDRIESDIRDFNIEASEGTV